MEVHSHRVLNHLGHLVKTIIGASPIQDPHLEQVKKDWIIDVSLIHPSKPFHPLDHIGPEPIVEEEIWVHIPPSSIMDHGFVVR